ncbi:MAG: sigma-70 family RNA polymerase sigma factor [Clostridium sp.]|nr:sigma-70 family RNA polymerase sigma factor [Clostridium sp.]
MDTLQQQRDLIEKLVKSNNKFTGNEDLLDDFCSETYKRSHSLFDSLEIKDLESYIAKVANTAILAVLKDYGRVRRRENKYVSTQEILISPVPAKTKTQETAPVPVLSQVVSSVAENFVYEIADPSDSFEEKIVRKDLLQKIVDIVLVAQKNQPEKEYLKIFYLRYVKELKQKEIAADVNLSQSEVSKRLIEIAQIVKTHF